MDSDETSEKQEFLKRAVIGMGLSKENFLDFISQKKTDGQIISIRCE
jgi:hypothetical protein